MLMETDCLEVVNLWDSRVGSRSVIAPLLLEIDGLASTFTSFVIQHVIRSSNVPSHPCAKLACSQEMSDAWMELPPSFLVASIVADNVGAETE